MKLSRIIRRIRRTFRGPFSSAAYWDARYREGGNSGVGSYGKFANYKAEFINAFVDEHHLRSTIEFGCGDSAQAALFVIQEYTGVDVSPRAVEMCEETLGGRVDWRFVEASERQAYSGRYDLVLSLDVVYHLIDEAAYNAYMADLFDHARSHVLVYASDDAAPSPAEHVRHRCHSAWVAEHRPEWFQAAVYENPNAGEWPEGTFAFFTHYSRTSA